jgi:hypothetical protein
LPDVQVSGQPHRLLRFDSSLPVGQYFERARQVIFGRVGQGGDILDAERESMLQRVGVKRAGEGVVSRQ